MAKIPVNFRVEPEVLELFRKLSEKKSRSLTNMFVALVKEAAEKEKIKADAETSA